MADKEQFALPDALQLNPRFWVYDPIPPWLIPILDKVIMKDLAIAHLEAQREALQLQARSLEKTLGIIKGLKVG